MRSWSEFVLIYVGVTMLISRRGLVPVASLISLMGAQVDAHHWLQRQGPPGPSSTSIQAPSSTQASESAGASATATASPAYFSTQWRAFTSPYALNSQFQVSYEVLAADPSISQQGPLNLVLLWTSAGAGTPDSTNTYSVATSLVCEFAIIQDLASLY